MELQNLKSPETIEFLKTQERLKGLLETTLNERTPVFNGEKYLTNQMLSDSLHISERLLNDYRREGKIPFIKISGKILYRESDILKIINGSFHPGFDRINTQ